MKIFFSVVALMLVLSAMLARAEGDDSWIELPFPGKLSVGVRAYFESAYLSSFGTLSYTKSVAEQVVWLYASLGDFGYLTTDGWLCSALNGETDHIHRRPFYCYEGTVRYGYAWRFTEEGDYVLDTSGGLLWDWLGGYKSHPGTPLAITVTQRFRNPWLTPYGNLLHRFDENQYARISTGVEHPFKPIASVVLTPYVESIWGDAARYRMAYGESPSYCFLNGAYMVGVAGLLAEWKFLEHWYMWGRFRQFATVNPAARGLAHRRATMIHHTDRSIYGIGVGCRF